MNGDAFSLDELSTGPDDQAKTLRILVSSSRAKRVSEIIREIEAEEERRDTRVLSAFLTRRGSEAPDILTMPHRLIVVAGGRPGAGSTTIARNLAAEAVSRGLKVEYLGPAVAQALNAKGAETWKAES